MKVHLAIAAAVLALGVSAFTPTPAAAVPPGEAQPSGFVICTAIIFPGGIIPFGPLPPCIAPPPKQFLTAGQAARSCVGLGGHPVLVVIDGGGTNGT